jgi:phosphoglycolate phosphatase-like HAD superfamily hydrolase
MRATDDKTIRAFLMAIAQLDRPISDEIQQVIDQAKDAIAHQSPEAAADQLHQLANHSSLHDRYQACRQQLTQRYQAQERSKSLAWAEALPTDNLDQILQLLNNPEAMSIDQQASSQKAIRPNFWKRGDRVVTLASGGAFLGVLLAQIPGAVIGGLLAAIYAWFSAESEPDRNV